MSVAGQSSGSKRFLLIPGLQHLKEKKNPFPPTFSQDFLSLSSFQMLNNWVSLVIYHLLFQA